MPFKYMGAVMFGQGLAAIGCNLIRGISLVTFPVDEKDPDSDINYFYGALMFLGIGGLMLLACCALQLCFLNHNEFYIYYLDWKAAEKYQANKVTMSN